MMRNTFYSYSKDYINRWVISYADFVTMLLALFMVMYALSQINISNLKKFSNSVGHAFEFNKYYKINGKDVSENRLLELFSTTEAKLKINSVDISSQQEQIAILKEKINKTIPNIDKEAVEFENVKNQIKRELGGFEGLSVIRESRGLTIRFKDSLIFDQESDIIIYKNRILLDKLAGVLKEIPNSVRIEVHTDNIPLKTSKFPSNWELSNTRAANIVKYLIEKYKFSPDKLAAVGYGEYMPKGTNKTEEGRSANRRVDIVILISR